MPTAKKSAKKAAKKPAKSFEETLWDTANKLRGSVESSEYKHVVLSLIFLKFVSDKFEERRGELVAEGKEDYLDMVEFYTMQNVFYLPETSRWSYIQQQAKQGDIAIKIDSALSEVEKSNASLKGALPDNYFSRLGLDGSKLSALIDAINNIDTVEDKEEDTIEGRNQNNEGRKRSQRTHHAICAANHPPFRKPAEINRGSDSWQTTSPLRNIRWGELSRSPSWPEQSRVHREVRRLTAGTGGIGVLAGTPGRKRNRASRQAPTIAGRVRRTHRHLRHHHQTSTGERQLKSEGRLGKEELPPLLHSSFSLQTFPTPPTGNANYAWILHMVSKLSENGVAGFVLANGSMSTNTKGEGEIRQKMVENDLVDCMIALPGQLFFTTQIPVCIWILSKNKSGHAQSPSPQTPLPEGEGLRDRSGETLFIDARKIGSMISRTQKELTAEDLSQIADTYHAWKHSSPSGRSRDEGSENSSSPSGRSGDEGQSNYENIPGYCYSAALEDIRKHDYVLTPGRYVGAAALEDDGIPFETKMTELSQTLYAQMEESAKLDEVIRQNLKGLGYAK